MNYCRVELKRGYSIDVRPDNETVSNDVVILGNYSKSDYNATVIVSKYGLCPTVRENHGQVIGIEVEDDIYNK